jgi:NAD(P)-dependent dehydrogenase (short-subunit alcohol dehydrogenase family)
MGRGSRIVNVSSRAHYWGSLSIKDGLITDHPSRWWAARRWAWRSSRPAGSLLASAAGRLPPSRCCAQQLHAPCATRRSPCRRAPACRFSQYARSKLCNTLFTLELQQRLQQRGITAASISPGFVSTNIFAGLPWGVRWLLAPLAPLVGRTPAKVGRRRAVSPFGGPGASQQTRPPAHAAHPPAVLQGAETVVYAAASPELEGRSVLFLHDCKEKEPSAAARDERLARALWDASEALVGLRPGEGLQ